MWKLAIVWILSSGQIEGQPWQDYPDEAACSTARQNTHGSPDKMIMFSACMKADLIGQFTAFDFNLRPGDKK